MKAGKKTLQMFKMKNRKGYAAICDGCLTEGKTRQQAYARMLKAIKRTSKKKR